MVDWRMTSDYLRCNPDFHNHPRYDCVLLQKTFAISNSIIDCTMFGRLLRLFSADVAGTTYSLALVRPLNYIKQRQRDNLQRRDKELEFVRVKEEPLSRSIVCSIHSIIRGVVAVHDSRRHDEYIIMDTLDADLFLRLRPFKYV